MRLPALLLLAAAAISAFHIPTEEEKVAAWNKLTVLKTADFNEGVPAGYNLIFVNNIWRHGDRGPTETFVGNVLDEDDWDFGGGGYGELSPIGMEQHFHLGEMMFERYAENGKFLSERYRAKEIYARSTDKNRTLISAMSNFAGMYSRASAVNGTDYPSFSAWPVSFVPVPIHTEDQHHDHVGDPDADCDRQDDLWDILVHKHPEYVNYENKPRTQQTLKYLIDATGSDSNGINFDNVWLIRGGMLCESIHFPDNFSDWYPWYTPDVAQQTAEVDDQNIDFQNGVYANGMVDGYDLTLEIPMIRGGPLINDVLEKARGVMDCYETVNSGKVTRCTDGDHWLKNLKYYVISGHDTSIAAYLTVLEAKPYVLRNGGYPSYSSAIITEFFIDSNTNERYFRILFHDNPDEKLRVITPYVSGCEMGSDFCKIEHLQTLADKYAPRGGIEELCKQRINGPAADTTTVAPPPPTTVPTTTTTKQPDNQQSTIVTVPTLPPTTSPSSAVSSLLTFFIVSLAALFI